MASNAKDKARLRSIKLAEHIAKNHYFVNVYGMDGKVNTFNLQGQRRPIYMREAQAIERASLEWRIYCCALCRHPVDGDYLRVSPVVTPKGGRAKQSDIEASLSEFHYDWLLANCNMKQVLTLGWIITTSKVEPDDYVASRMFGTAWDEFDTVVVDEDGRIKTNPRNPE